MARKKFIMKPGRSGSERYICLIFVPPMVFMILFMFLAQYSSFDISRIWHKLVYCTSLVYIILALICFLAIKQRSFEIKGNIIIEYSSLGKCIKTVKVNQISYAKRNLLDEILLMDESGTILCRICPHLENRILFVEWLLHYKIRC